MSLHAAEWIAGEMIAFYLSVWAIGAVWVRYQSRKDRGGDK